MGLSSSKKTTTSQSSTKPIYESQILGEYGNVKNAFDQNAGNVADIQSQLSGLMGTAVGNYNNNSTLDAAKSYVTSTLGSGYNSSPYLQDMIDQTNTSVGNATTAALGTRGLTGGSSMAKILSGQLAQNETGLRYNDYNNWQDRQAQAVGMAPSLSSADATNLSGVLGLSDQAASLTSDEALKRAASVGGLLGGYTNSNGTETTKQSGGLIGGLLGSVLSGWASGGFKS